jgi:hypothetical protein
MDLFAMLFPIIFFTTDSEPAAAGPIDADGGNIGGNGHIGA